DLRDRVEVAVQELAEPAVVVDGAGAGAACDEQLETGDAERVLNVDGDEADPRGVFRGRAEGVLAGPRLGPLGALLVGHSPDLADRLGIEVRWNREQRRLV